jgi:hypothetical protein
VEALWHGVDPTHPLHHLPSAEPARQALERVYEATDELIGDLTAAFPDTAQLIFSMHGMGPNDSDVPSMALLPEFLFRRSFGRPLMRNDGEDPRSLLMVEENQDWGAHVNARMIERPDRGPATEADLIVRWQDSPLALAMPGGGVASSGAAVPQPTTEGG